MTLFGLALLGMMALCATVALVASAYVALRRLALGAPPASLQLDTHKQGRRLGPRQVRECQLPLPYHQAFDACIEALSFLRRAKIERLSRDEGVITARSRADLRSFGSRITLEVIPIDAHTTYLRLRTEPVVVTTVLDYGRSREEVELLMTALARRCAPHLTAVTPAKPALLTST